MKRPNFLIVMTDHQRGDTVLPEHPAITPNLTKFAEDGVTFSQNYIPMAHCSPSRATFHSGLYPSRHGVWNNVSNGMALSRGLNPGVRLFSEDLADAGYNMNYVGKWHVSAVEAPRDRGWHELRNYPQSTVKDESETWEQLREDAQKPEPSEREAGEIVMPGYRDHTLYGASETRVKGDERSLELALEALPDMTSGDDPWAMFVGWNMPHAPYILPQRYIDQYNLDDVQLPVSYWDNLLDKPNYYRKLREMRFGQLDELKTRDAMRHFWAMCTYLDEMFGKLLAALEKTGQVDNTVVLYCSDHGDYCGDHGLFHKGVPAFRGAYHVPAIVRWPAGIANPGRRVEELISLADFAPTFLDLAGIETDRYFTGSSLLPFLRDEKPDSWREEVCTQCNGVENYFTQRTITTKDFKYVYNGFDYDELYDLRIDPHEMRNVQADPAYADIKRDLVQRMWRFAYQEQDTLGSSGLYIMISTAAYGPMEGLRGVEGENPPPARGPASGRP